MRIRNKRRGSALGVVLIFMTVMLLLGVALLTASQSSASQSAGGVKADTNYYAAESAAQLAAQMFFSEWEESGVTFYEVREGIPYSGIDLASALYEMESSLVSRAENELQDIFDRVSSEVNGMELNGEAVTLKALGIDSIELESDFVMASEDGIDTYTAIVYLKDPSFIMSATSGGRTVTIKTGYDTEQTTVVVEQEGAKFPDYNGGAFYQDKTGGIYGNGSSEAAQTAYDMFIEALRTLVSRTNSMTRESVLDLNNGKNTYTATSGLTTSSVYAQTGTITISGGTAASPVVYQNLEYLDVSGNLTISGNAVFPNLKGVYVSGSMTVSGGASINAMVKSGAAVTDSRKPNSGPSDFLVQNGIVINCATELNWCRFYAQKSEIVINHSGNAALTSNSIFIATKDDAGNRGSIRSVGQNFRPSTNGAAPQFYAESDIWLNIQNQNTVLIGVYVTLSNSAIFDNTACTLQGLFVGNCGNNNSTVNDFTVANNEYMIDGGLFDIISQEGEGAPKILVDMEAELMHSSLNIRETTGE